MKMKKTILWALVIMLAIPATAQTYRRPAPGRSSYAPQRNDRHHPYAPGYKGSYYGLRIGGNLSSISSEDVSLDTDSYGGLYVAGIVGTQLSRYSPVWMETGLAYSEKGGSARSGGDRVKYRLGYLELPVTIKYDIAAGDVSVQPFLGGYLALGVAGQIKDYDMRRSESVYDTFNHFDGGLRLGCGLAYQMLYIEAGVDIGLANINKDDFNTAHNQALFLTAGVNF